MDAVSLGRTAVDNSLKLATHSYDVEFDKAFPTISVCASLAPMLGLLGTVSGMVHVFSTIQLFGFGNPVLIADGISEALLTTQAGLLVSFPIVLANNQLLSRLNHLKAKCWKEALQFENEKLHMPPRHAFSEHHGAKGTFLSFDGYGFYDHRLDQQPDRPGGI